MGLLGYQDPAGAGMAAVISLISCSLCCYSYHQALGNEISTILQAIRPYTRILEYRTFPLIDLQRSSPVYKIGLLLYYAE